MQCNTKQKARKCQLDPAPQAPLGISTKSASEGSERRLTKWGAQAEASRLYPGSRTSTCCRVMMAGEVSLEHSAESDATCFTGVLVCGSVWQCPVCASKISDGRRDELTAALCAAKNLGLRAVLVTTTVRHKKADDLKDTVDGLLKARRLMRSGRRAKAFAGKWGLVGSVRALEVTVTQENGWHPHVHEVLFLEVQNLEGLEEDLRAMWSSAVHAAGLPDVNGHGIDVQAADEQVAGYVAKFGEGRAWTAAHELTLSASKTAGRGGRSPSQLLKDSAGGDTHAGLLWLTYAAVFKGRRQLVWSRFLRDRLGLGVERSDEELAEEVPANRVRLVAFNREMWCFIVRGEWRGEVLQAARGGQAGAVWAFLQTLPGWRWGDGSGALRAHLDAGHRAALYPGWIEV